MGGRGTRQDKGGCLHQEQKLKKGSLPSQKRSKRRNTTSKRETPPSLAVFERGRRGKYFICGLLHHECSLSCLAASTAAGPPPLWLRVRSAFWSRSDVDTHDHEDKECVLCLSLVG